LPFYRWEDIKAERLNPLNSRKVIVGQRLMLAEFTTKKGSVVPTHKHIHEQISFVLKGRVKFTVGGEELLARKGDIIVIPPNVEHSAVTMTDSIGLDVFTPLRDDWMTGDDAYLRGTNAPTKARRSKS
jgi:quercetin dioxygenase-like cupin family protein